MYLQSYRNVPDSCSIRETSQYITNDNKSLMKQIEDSNCDLKHEQKMGLTTDSNSKPTRNRLRKEPSFSLTHRFGSKYKWKQNNQSQYLS